MTSGSKINVMGGESTAYQLNHYNTPSAHAHHSTRAIDLLGTADARCATIHTAGAPQGDATTLQGFADWAKTVDVNPVRAVSLRGPGLD